MGIFRKTKNKKGFTLVELIVVIAILAVIAGVVAPMLISQVNVAKAATDTANAKTIENAILRAVASGTLATPLVDSAATVTAITSEVSPIPSCKVTGNKFVVTKASGRVKIATTVTAATEFEIVP